MENEGSDWQNVVDEVASNYVQAVVEKGLRYPFLNTAVYRQEVVKIFYDLWLIPHFSITVIE